MTVNAGTTDKAKLNALLANLDVGDVADPALRAQVFQEVYDYLDANWQAFKSEVSGTSGADQVHATALNAQSGSTVQAIFTYLLAQIQGVSQGGIADGSVTLAHLAFDPATQIELNVVTDNINRLSYDLYALWLEQYYIGEATASPDPSGAKAITFDGFLNTNNVDTPNTTAIIDTTNKEVGCSASVGTYQTPLNITRRDGNITFLPGWQTTNTVAASTPMDLNALRDGNLSTGTSQSYSAATAFRYLLIVDLGISKIIDSVEFYGAGQSTNLKTCFEGIAVSDDNVTFTDVTSYFTGHVGPYNDTTGKTNTTPASWTTANATAGAPKGRYVAFNLTWYNASGSALTGNTYEVRCKTRDNLYQSNSLRAKQKTLSFTAKRVELFLSESTPSGTLINPQLSFDGGVTFVSGTVKSSRTDPKFGTFTEYQLEFIGSGTGIIFKADLTPSNGINGTTPKIKRYGVFCYDV